MSSVASALLGSPAPVSTGVTTGTGTTVAGSGILGSIGNSIAGPVVNAVTSTVANGLEATIFSSRVVAIVLGLILIAGAILLYIGEDLAGAIESGKSGVAKVGAAVAA